ncbi:MAG: J domain-containing protein [Solirubrobacteraceae bacterium]|nr:J domain-containing protein [Solirubrobacteraceae bacterium]
MDHKSDVYAVLGTDRTADDAELRRAYRSAARVIHPDAGGTEGAFRILQAAWEEVRTPECRAAYDAGGRRGRPALVLGDARPALPGRAPEGWPGSMLDRRSGVDRRDDQREPDRRTVVRRFTRPAVEVPVRFARFDAGAADGTHRVDARA